ncbi:4-hydroxyphenylpyruvate dioxygenase [Streptomyces kanamyceticus]|uniref:4-hydroxyphenylpyruvate dioxygenase n=1 Tax=Streptomyces kanamyceticus TaxID=1967 RepID=A0A5J6G848_STRKN|nr:4-hydroxyphenylpyruvate dioxygenase [Streptomyces kanamyceticus]QEU91127.1 4-hydroxyphenylpyruvate dioxygenase [Streptomyces kanamyceticus]
MSPTTIAYSELYTAREDAATSYFTDRFGFRLIATAGPETGTADRRSWALRNGAVTLVVTAPVGEDGEVSRYLDAHGDSFADLAFVCEDLPVDFARATGAGATALREPADAVDPAREDRFAVVSGFGDLRHTLVQPSQSPAGSLPPDRRWNIDETAAADTPATATVLGGVDHIAACLPVDTLKRTVDFYNQAFDLHYFSEEYILVGDQAMDSKVVRNESGGITFTLIEPDPTRNPGQIDQFLAAHGGAGVQHLAFLVEDIIGSVRELGGRGVEFLNTPATYYDVIRERVGDLDEHIADLRETNVLVDRDEWGHLLQIFTRSPYERGTVFYELIQRNGAQGFGSSNIKALYEAVERARETANK